MSWQRIVTKARSTIALHQSAVVLASAPRDGLGEDSWMYNYMFTKATEWANPFCDRTAGAGRKSSSGLILKDKYIQIYLSYSMIT